jgi:GNAT superfamily N-acetyltransferase
MRNLRPSRDGDLTTLLDIINAAAQAYRGVIPADRWHDPYMTAAALADEISAGVQFWCCEEDGEVLGIMGIQTVRDADLIRHAYVRPGLQRGGIGTALLRQLVSRSPRRLLVGTWSDARWAIDFYARNGFSLASPERARELLRDYWSIPERQVATSVVLEYFAGRGPTCS